MFDSNRPGWATRSIEGHSEDRSAFPVTEHYSHADGLASLAQFDSHLDDGSVERGPIVLMVSLGDQSLCTDSISVAEMREVARCLTEAADALDVHVRAGAALLEGGARS